MKYYSIYFTGQAHEHVTIAQLKINLSKLFKMDLAKIEQLFTGKAVVIKKGLNLEEAKKYHQALTKAGAKVIVKEIANHIEPSAYKEPSANIKPSAKSETNKETEKDKVQQQNSQPENAQLNSALAGLINYNQNNTPLQNQPNVENQPASPNLETETETEPETEQALTRSPPNAGSLEEFSTRNTEFTTPDLSAYSISDKDSGSLEEFAEKVIAVEIADISYMDITDQNDRPLSDQSVKAKPVELPDIEQLSLVEANTGSLEEFAVHADDFDTSNFSDIKLEK